MDWNTLLRLRGPVLAGGAVIAVAVGCHVEAKGPIVDCSICDSPANANFAGQCVEQTTCANAACATCVGMSCSGTFADCNGDSTDGCESDRTSDAKNCGACGHACAGGCMFGSCDDVTVLASGLDGVNAVVVTTTDVWWATSNGHADVVAHVSKNGGAVSTIARPSLLTGALATDGARFAWSKASVMLDGGAPSGGIELMTSASSSPASIANGLAPVGPVGLTGGSVLWMESSASGQPLDAWSEDAGVHQLAPGSETSPSTTSTGAFVTVANHVFWVQGNLNEGRAFVRALDLTTGTTMDLDAAQAVASDGATVIALRADPKVGAVVVEYDGNGASTATWNASLPDAHYVSAAVADARSIYLTIDDSSLWHLDRSAHTADLFASVGSVRGIAIDDDAIYWAAASNILRAKKR